MNKMPMYLIHVRAAEGEKYCLTLLPPTAYAKMIPPEAIVGGLLRPLQTGEAITPDVFARNSLFVKFLHGVIAKHAPNDPACQLEAQRLGTGWIYIIDQRTKTPGGNVPLQDIIGAMQVHDGIVVQGSYQAIKEHRILSEDGFFQLPTGLYECLLRELQSRATA